MAMYVPTEEESAVLSNDEVTARQFGRRNAQNDSECPRGYSGDDCSVKVDDCPAQRSDLVNSCYYGSLCVDASNEFGLLDRYCECDTAEELAAGLMCQYKATAICIADGEEGRVTDQYCVNGGVCVAFVGADDRNPGCICEEGKWEGTHCEFTHELLLDDALDLFQQRKAELASERLIGGGDLSSTVTFGEGGGEEKRGIPLILVAGSVVTTFVVIKLSMIAAWKSRKSRRRSKEEDYRSLAPSSAASTKATLESTLPPPANVFVTSQKKGSNSYDGSSFIISPGGHVTETHDDQTDDVEVLDAETSQMIEAQFGSSETNRYAGGLQVNSSGEDPGGEPVFAPSYDSDSIVSDEGGGLLHSGRITVNKGKSPLSKLQNGSVSDAGAHAEKSDAVICENEDNAGADEHANDCSNGVKSLDGEYDDDSDDDNYYV